MNWRHVLAFSRYPEFAQRVWWLHVVPRRLRAQGLSIGDDVQFLGMPIVTVEPGSQLVIGDRTTLCSVSTHTALGVNHPVVLRTLRSEAVLEIGADTGISGASICAAVSVRIGAQCLIGANVTIVDTDFHAMTATNRRYNRNPIDIGARPVYIGNNVFLGAGATVLKGVTIGANSVVGAGAVVATNVPPGVVVAGNPAHVVRELGR